MQNENLIYIENWTQQVTLGNKQEGLNKALKVWDYNLVYLSYVSEIIFG